MAYNSKYTGAEVEELLDKVKDSQLWGYECFAVKKEGMDDPDTLKQEIEAFIEAGGGDADPLIKLIQDAGLGNAYIHLVNGEEESVLTIDGAEVTLGAGQVYAGYVSSVSYTTNYIREFICIGTCRPSRTEYIERIEEYFPSDYSFDYSYGVMGCTALKRLVLAGGACKSLQAVSSGNTALDYFDGTALNTSNVTAFGNLFYNNTYLAMSQGGVLDLSTWDVSNVIAWGYCFTSCRNIKTLKIGLWAIADGAESFANTFSNMNALENIEGELRNIKSNVLISGSSNLTRESALVILNGLYDFASEGEEGGTVTFHSSAKARLTDDDIAIATNKGWTIA